AQSFLAGERRDLKFCGENRGQRSFAARENIGEIIRRAQKSFDAVTRPAFNQPWWPALGHFGACRPDEVLNLRALNVQRIVRWPDLLNAAIGHDNLERTNVICCRSVNRATRA